MAFKILSQEEIAILNKREKEAYEQEYQEYLERTAFVERLKQLEKVHMPKVSIKKKAIKKVKFPAIPIIQTKGFIADAAMGVELLSVTQNLSHTLNSYSKSSIQINHRASLPSVFISAPDIINSEKNSPFVVTGIESVPIAKSVPIKYEFPEFSAIIPEIQRMAKSEFTEIVIENYSINGLPRVKVELPQTFIKDIQLNFKTHFPFIKIVKPRVEKIEVAQHDTVVLKPVTVTKPDTIDVSIEDYKVPRFVMNTVNAPILSYTPQKINLAELSSVPIPKYYNISNTIRETMTAASMSSSSNAVEKEEKEFKTITTKLPNVCTPVFAPQIKIPDVSIKGLNAQVISTPKEIHYLESDYKVVTNRPPSIAVPHIDVEAELKIIFSKVR